MSGIQRSVSSPERIGIVKATVLALPHIFGAALVGLAIYNPSSWCLWQVVFDVVVKGVGVVSDVAWYYQPAYWLVTIGFIALGIVAWFHWQIARGEWWFLLLFIVLWAAVNGLILSIAVITTQTYLFSWTWVHWQIVPAIFAGLYFAVKMPKIRRRYTGAITETGAFDASEHDEHHSAGHG
ncbi:MAG: hypothetical protein HC900_04270 [Methylacidiphilales bacterium]|nr:hypothetical protein [Candidatus Methylacidiphilales bacterium]